MATKNASEDALSTRYPQIALKKNLLLHEKTLYLVSKHSINTKCRIESGSRANNDKTLDLRETRMVRQDISVLMTMTKTVEKRKKNDGSQT
ncbi:MAG: hypothetical protein CMK28_03905 [Porticoccaceae bacterium]|nr:hypothetical protein [Porticoccaceae bacterium]